MSQENVELASQAFDAVNRRDLDALLALIDDDARGSRVSLIVRDRPPRRHAPSYPTAPMRPRIGAGLPGAPGNLAKRR
jgi:hypothetical protein